MTFKPFLVFHLNLIPRWVTAHDVKSLIGCKYLRELHAPMEETLFISHTLYFCLEVGRELAIVSRQWLAFFKAFHSINFLKRTHHGLGIWNLSFQNQFFIAASIIFIKFVFLNSMVKCTGIDVACTAQTIYSCRFHQLFPSFLLDDFFL